MIASSSYGASLSKEHNFLIPGGGGVRSIMRLGRCWSPLGSQRHPLGAANVTKAGVKLESKEMQDGATGVGRCSPSKGLSRDMWVSGSLPL